jgi:hypothetical protein
MSKFNIKVARIEAAASSRLAPQVCVTFQIDRDTVSFQVPIHLSVSDYDDTEMVQAARNALHRTFAELSVQSRDWRLSTEDLRQLSGMSLRPQHDKARPRLRHGLAQDIAQDMAQKLAGGVVVTTEKGS